MGFAEAHHAFIQHHLDRRKGERRDRLVRGHRHAEQLFLQKVWFPFRGNFDHLHPEYEVLDWWGRSYFADFAYLPHILRILIEIKGYKSHIQDMDRTRFCNEQNRELYLQSLGYRIFSFAYDDVEQRPELSMSMLTLLMGQYETTSTASPDNSDILAEKELIRHAIRLARPLRPIDAASHLAVNYRTALRLIKQLVAKGWLHPAPNLNGSTGGKINGYLLDPKVWRHYPF